MNSKQEKYKYLVSLRKSCKACNELSNPSRIENGSFDSSEIGPWTKWQGNLDSEIMLIAQDWGGLNNFIKYKGTDINSRTNKEIKKLFEFIGLGLTLPLDNARRNSYFFTNAILCIKKGDDQKEVKKEWYCNCGPRFLKPLIEIVKPRVVICLGKWAYDTVMMSYCFRPGLFRDAVDRHVPMILKDDIAMFPVYHCSAGGTNRNRSPKEQLNDWYYIAEWLKKYLDK